MNLTRLMALGVLARSGASHGHQIRRIAEVTNVGEWGGVSVGALYRELRAMEREGLVEAARTEKVGRRPERTVYEITALGHLELGTLREKAIRQLEYGPDPVGVALLFSADEVERQELRRMLRARRDILAVRVREVTADRKALLAKGHIDELAAAIMRRAELHIEAEIRWHDEYDALLADAVRPGPDTAGPGAAGHDAAGPGTAGPGEADQGAAGPGAVGQDAPGPGAAGPGRPSRQF
jgi:DNA-binding PadR family transcriptional regulator